MTMSEPDIWAFEPVPDMSPAQQQRWLEQCYVKTNVDQLFADPERSVVVVTHAGCGISTSLARLRSYGLLSFLYDPDQWPGQLQAFTTATDHFGQWMSHVAFSFVDQIRQKPALLEKLSLSNYEFLTWIVRRYLNRNQHNKWLHALQEKLDADLWQLLNATINSDAFDSLFGRAVADMVGQIDECLDVAHRFGWRGIYASIDIRWADWIKRTPEQRKELKEGLNQLLMTLTPLQRPGFGFKMGLPHHLFSIAEARVLLRGRATVVNYDWAPPAIMDIAMRLIAQSTGDLSTSARLLPTDVWKSLSTDLAAIWETPGPAAAAALAFHTLQLDAESSNTLGSLRRRLYRSSARLRLDNDMSQGQVWRGMTPIKLTDALFEVFKKLWNYQGELVSNKLLWEIAGSKNAADQNIKRIRQAIEPFYEEKDYVYIIREEGRGVRLDKASCYFD